jgi:hypothetical protein
MRSNIARAPDEIVEVFRLHGSPREKMWVSALFTLCDG